MIDMTNETEAVRAVKRYEQGRIGMRENDAGEWISYTDHAALIDRLTGEVRELEDRCTMLHGSASFERRRKEAAERRVARYEKELYEDRAELLSCRMNIAADLHKGNNAWEGVPKIIDARVKAITDVLTQPEADHG
jgi:hypothetical protein